MTEMLLTAVVMLSFVDLSIWYLLSGRIARLEADLREERLKMGALLRLCESTRREGR